MDDERLIPGVLAGNRDAERLLYDRHVDRVFRLAFRLCGEEEVARELTQRAFIRVFDRIGQFRGDAALSSWIFRVATSVILSGVEQQASDARRLVPLDAAETSAPARATSIQPDPWLRAALDRAIDALPARRRAVFLMHDVEEFTHEEIGEVLGIRAGTSKAHLHHARTELRAALAAYAPDR